MVIITETSTHLTLTLKQVLRDNQTGDAFPLDPNQWADADGDGFGDFQGGEFRYLS